MIPTINYDQLYFTHLKGNEELYIKKNSIVVIHEDKGNTLTLNLKTLRCVFPTSNDSFKVFRRVSKYVKNTDMKVFEIYEHEFKLDLKKSFPDKKQRKEAEKTEAKKISTIILHAIQNLHPVNTPNMKANLAMHTGEYVHDIYESELEESNGELVITNLGLYFVSNEKGLDLDLPLDLIDSYDFKNNTVKIHYFEPTMRAGYEEGYEPISKKNCRVKIKINKNNPSKVCDTITAACSEGGIANIQELQTLTEEFGSMTPDQLHAAYYAGDVKTPKPIDEYFSILAKRQWGVPNTPEVAIQDRHVVAACLTTGLPLDAAGGLAPGDKEFRDATKRYVENYNDYFDKYDQLYIALKKIITLNLSESEALSLRACHPRVTDDTIQQMAKIGSIPDDSFEPESLAKWKKFVRLFNEDLMNQNLSEYQYGFNFDWKFKIICPWSIEDAKRIVKDKNYISITEVIKSIDEEYISSLHTTPPIHPELIVKGFQTTQGMYAAIRVGRVYEEWCKTNPLSKFNDPTDRDWVQYITENQDKEKLERIREYYGKNETPVEELNRFEIQSQNHKIRLERTTIPKDIPEKDIYADAWFDAKKHRWFTTSQYFRITEPELEIMNSDECGKKYGFKAIVFSEDAVQLKHGMPAVYDEDKKWWILLCTVSDDKITKEMVQDKWTDLLKYDAVESNAGVSDGGGIDYATTQEQIYNAEFQTDRDNLLPLNERLRRFLFSSIVAWPVSTLSEKQKLEELAARV